MKIPVSIDELKELGKVIATSGLFGCENVEQGVAIAMICYSEDISLLEYDSKYNLVNGKIAIRTAAMLANFQEYGGKVEIHERSRERASATFKYDGIVLKDELSFETVKDMDFTKTKKGETKSTWLNFPHSMLWARLCSDCIRAICPRALRGMYVPEEVEDMAEDNEGTNPPSEPNTINPLEICPENAGSLSGQFWKDGDSETLQKYLTAAENESYGLTKEYVPFIQAVLEGK